MQIVAWSLTNQAEKTAFEKSEFKGSYKSFVKGTHKRLDKNAKLEAKSLSSAVWCGWNLPKSFYGTYWLFLINDKSQNCRHEHERLVKFNHVTFWTSFALNKCRFCVLYG